MAHLPVYGGKSASIAQLGNEKKEVGEMQGSPVVAPDLMVQLPVYLRSNTVTPRATFTSHSVVKL